MPDQHAAQPPDDPGARIEWVDDATLVVDGVTFVCRTSERFRSTADRFCLVKRPDLVRNHLRVIEEVRPEAVVELGIFQGGSTALLAMLARPAAMAVIELNPERVVALDELLADRQLSDHVHLAYGQSQSDPDAISAALAAAGLADRPLDLVIDDASHLVDHTRTSFELLFPRLRPGGRYIIEDWSWAHIGYGLHLPDEQPLTQLVFELTMALPSSHGIISEIHIDRDWMVITRGDAPIDPGSFSVRSLYNERGRQLLASTD